MRRAGLLLGLLFSCTAAEPSDPPPVVATPQPGEAEVDPSPASEPKLELDHDDDFRRSEEPWVWFEERFARHSCLPGCPKRAIARTSKYFDPPYVIEQREPEAPRLVAFKDNRGEDDYDPEYRPERWHRVLELNEPFRTAPDPRVRRCGPLLYAAFARRDRAEYRVLRFDAESGTPLPGVAEYRHSDGPSEAHSVQVGCLDEDGLRVFGRFSSGGDEVLYVHELNPELSRVASRRLAGGLAHAELPTPAQRKPKRRVKTALRYRFSGGEREPWPIGLGNTEPTRVPKHLQLEAKDGKRSRWTVDLGPALNTDLQVLEFGPHTLVRIGGSLTALDRSTGAQQWQTGGRDWLREETRIPGEMGIYGCSRCRETHFHVRTEGETLVLAGFGGFNWTNVIDPATGRIIAIRLWSG